MYSTVILLDKKKKKKRTKSLYSELIRDPPKRDSVLIIFVQKDKSEVLECSLLQLKPLKKGQPLKGQIVRFYTVP